MKVALVTGGSRGLGYALVEGLIEQAGPSSPTGAMPARSLSPTRRSGRDRRRGPICRPGGRRHNPAHRSKLKQAAIALGGWTFWSTMPGSSDRAPCRRSSS